MLKKRAAHNGAAFFQYINMSGKNLSYGPHQFTRSRTSFVRNFFTVSGLSFSNLSYNPPQVRQELNLFFYYIFSYLLRIIIWFLNSLFIYQDI